MMRVISGGIDYGVGLEKGASYGLQEILGVEVDMDHAGWDAIQNQLAHLDDARRDMERIAVPVTWIHGRYDAWMDPVRAVDILSRGDTAKRRFIEVPTGHSLRSSREALDVFQLVTSEIARFVLGRSIPKVLPELAALERRRRAERERLKHPDVNLRAFWRNYLLGRSGLGGFDLMTRIEAYRDLMRIQIRELRLLAGARVADLGAGTGAFLAGLSRFQDISGAHVLELDFVRDALRHARARARSEIGDRHRVSFIEVDLNQGRAGSLPLNNTSLDAVLGSLLISYVPDPARMLAEIHRVLRPGGRLVLSVLRRDADMSKLFVEGLEELRVGNETCGSRRDEIDEAARDYLNQASSLLDLEEAGVFRFWDSEELVELVSSSGFTELGVDQCFGDPPQAVVVSATRA
jgi:ubiquinone/menaquinone biosynthesis C-methylase UbiE